MAKKRHEEHEGHSASERWLITYADMITLLMVFFIVLYSMANTDLKKFAQVAESMQVAFNVSPIGSSPGGAIITSAGGGNGSASSSSPLNLQGTQRQRDFMAVSAQLGAFAAEAGLEGAISINMTREGLLITLADTLLFEPGSAAIKPGAQETLDQLALLLLKMSNPVRVEGHTDNLPTNGAHYATNWELSASRAVSIVRYLSEAQGVAPERLSAAGYGDTQPVAPNDSREHRALNRRAALVILYPLAEAEAPRVIQLPPLNSAAQPADGNAAGASSHTDTTSH